MPKLFAAIIATMVLMLVPAAIQARGGHHGFGSGLGHGGGHGMHANGAEAFAGDRKHNDDPYVKAALEEEERVLKKLSSICRGC